MDFKIILYTFLGYLVGSIPWALVIGKLFYNTDIRNYGSGNLGATNAGRVLGKKNFYIVSVLDASKSLLVYFLLLSQGYHTALFAAAAVVIGHCFPIFSHFKGGKGVATCAGLLLAVSVGSLKTFLLQFMLPAIIFFAIAVITKYISLASMSAFTSAVIIMWIFNGDLATKIVFTLLCLFVIYRHRENIQRLLNHKENKVNFF